MGNLPRTPLEYMVAVSPNLGTDPSEKSPINHKAAAKPFLPMLLVSCVTIGQQCGNSFGGKVKLFLTRKVPGARCHTGQHCQRPAAQSLTHCLRR